ncbi:SCO family protein [Thalassotalea sp. PP2-459]|uniref:SCO family protein n=1 Tax=Thalassotalea sp. PP2-459 TaxID=1742724 RepID=UPI000943EC95|nr:SCO family protein [Thalassotalea sp. PP2-459]OKY27183.1 hypothetical protein BI291_09650 [Thalassotalea sp. PP2-459]
MRKWAFFLCCLFGITVSIIIASNFSLNKHRHYVKKSTIEWLDNPRPINTFTLMSDLGKFNNHSLDRHWTIVLFGYSKCADICPTSLFQMSLLAQQLSEQEVAHPINFVFVSVDHERVSIKNLGYFVKYFNPNFVGVSGSKRQLTALTDSLGIQFNVSKTGQNYTVAHSILLSIIGPKGELRGRFSPGFSAANIADELLQKMAISAVL